MKPIVSQLVAEPPATPESSVPSVNEVDDILVSCLGQMAVTAGSDLLWKPLNHEVSVKIFIERMHMFHFFSGTFYLVIIFYGCHSFLVTSFIFVFLSTMDLEHANVLATGS